MTENHHYYVIGLLLAPEPPRPKMTLPFVKNTGHMANNMRGNKICAPKQDCSEGLWLFVDLSLY